MPDNVKDNPVEKREALLADRLRLHRGYRQRFVKERNRHGRMPACLVMESARGGSMTLGELFEETYIQGEIAIRSYDSTGTTIEHYLGDAEEFYPDEHPQILEREVGYIFPLMEVEPTICIELKDEG